MRPVLVYGTETLWTLVPNGYQRPALETSEQNLKNICVVHGSTNVNGSPGVMSGRLLDTALADNI